MLFVVKENDVETCVLLSKLSNAKQHIEVTVDMDELDLTSAEAKETYSTYRELDHFLLLLLCF